MNRTSKFAHAALTTALGGVLTLAAAAQVVGPTYPHAHIYPETSQAQNDVQTALVEARQTHKRIILDFGGDWCPDCQVLNIYFNQSPNRELLEKHFIRVNVNIGHEDANLELAHKYGVPVTGVPALAVLVDHGKVIYAQTKEFSDMRHLQSSDLTQFLNKWKQ
jgi:thioredoxin 1